MIDLINYIVDEATYADVKNKQRSVTSLFPQFYDRVKKVAGAGGVRVVDMKKGQWEFKVHSSDKPIWYQDIVHFINIEDVIERNVLDKRLWKKGGSGVDLRYLAGEVLEEVDVKLFCSCPAFQYWGPAYILTKRNAKYTNPEDRRPRVRNPREYGSMCKHMQLVFDVLPFYTGTMSKFIKDFYMDIVAKAEKEVLGRDAQIQRAASDLAKREEEEKGKEEEGTEEEVMGEEEKKKREEEEKKKRRKPGLKRPESEEDEGDEEGNKPQKGGDNA